MAFVVEDGTGLELANALVDVAGFRSYHTDRGRNTSSISDTDVQTAIVRATDYMEQRFGARYRGERSTSEQGLSFPREGLRDDRGVAVEGTPIIAQRACNEYSLRAILYKELAPDPTLAAGTQDISDADNPVRGSAQSSGVVKSKERKLGPMSTKTMFEGHSDLFSLSSRASQSGMTSGIYIPEYPTADLWMDTLLSNRGGKLKRV